MRPAEGLKVEPDESIERVLSVMHAKPFMYPNTFGLHRTQFVFFVIQLDRDGFEGVIYNCNLDKKCTTKRLPQSQQF